MPNSVRKLVKAVASRLAGMEMCISRVISKWCLREISELDFSSKDLRWYCSGRCERGSGSGINSAGGEHVIPRDSLSLIAVYVYKPSVASQSTVIVNLADMNFEIAEQAASLKKRQRKWRF